MDNNNDMILTPIGGQIVSSISLGTAEEQSENIEDSDKEEFIKLYKSSQEIKQNALKSIANEEIQ